VLKMVIFFIQEVLTKMRKKQLPQVSYAPQGNL